MAKANTMKMKMVPPDSVELNPNNPRKGNMRKVKESIKSNGFLSPVVVQKSTNIVIAGNHRVRAARELKLEEIPAYIVDVDDATAERFLLADNKVSDEASYDEEALAKMLATVAEAGNLAGTAYTKKESQTIIARAEWQSEEDYAMRSEDRDAEKDVDIYKNERPDERTDILESLARRSMILSIPLKKHEKFTEALKNARKHYNVDSNEELVVEMLRVGGFLKRKFRLFDPPAEKEE